MEFYDVLIVGAGMSAMAAAKSFRALDAVSSVLMVSDQKDLPVKKPPLSKQLWHGLALSEVFYNPAKFNIDFRPGVLIESIDFRKKIARFSNGIKVNFASILFATGLAPVKLRGEAENVIYFNTLADFRALRRRISPGQSATVIGGGLLAAELSASLQTVGLNVSLVTPSRWPISRYLPSPLGNIVVSRLEKAGITLVKGRRAAHLEQGVHLDDDTVIESDHIIPVIGQVPSLDFLNLDEEERTRGLSVDHQLRVQGADGIFASGDIIRIQGFRESFRHEENAILSGSIAGKNLAGQSQSYSPSQFLYSEFLDLRLESIGIGRVDQQSIASCEWVESDSNGIALMKNQNRLERVTVLNHTFKPAKIRTLTDQLIGKPIKGEVKDLVDLILKKYLD